MGIQVVAILDCQVLVELPQRLRRIRDHDAHVLLRRELALRGVDAHVRHARDLEVQGHGLLSVGDPQHDVAPVVHLAMPELQHVGHDRERRVHGRTGQLDLQREVELFALELAGILILRGLQLGLSAAYEALVLHGDGRREREGERELPEGRHHARERRHRDGLLRLRDSLGRARRQGAFQVATLALLRDLRTKRARRRAIVVEHRRYDL
mmetsp:Transcript_28419/g.85715  ORF Transcript_28419/g.85715 Transcript_28419/m.85715 type:complete len:210 (-) Transcript_28419:713-1342(-)